MKTITITADWLPLGAIAIRVLEELRRHVGGSLFYGAKGYELEVPVRNLRKLPGTPQQALEKLIQDI